MSQTTVVPVTGPAPRPTVGGGAGRARLRSSGPTGPSHAVAGLRRVGRTLWAAGRAVRWYVRELMGDSAYERYLARFAVDHADAGHGEHGQPLSEREFWRRRIDNQAVDARCC